VSALERLEARLTGSRRRRRATGILLGIPVLAEVTGAIYLCKSTGMVYVERAGLDDAGVRRWVERAAGFARSLPPKAKT
jgi:hypothetical protein